MKLKDIRMSRSLTQKTVAEAIGCSAVVYSRYETGEREPSVDTLVHLANFFGVSLDFLIGREDVSPAVLSPYERELISAARQADERARRDALSLLNANCINAKKEHLA